MATLFGCHATSIDKLKNKVQMHHRQEKHFHMAKRLRKSVQYIRRYSDSTKYAKPRREDATQFQLDCSPPKLLDQSSPKFYTDIVALVVLFNHAYKRRYPIPFLNARATKVRSLPFFHKISCRGNVP